MNPDQYQRLNDIFHGAQALSIHERDAYLQEACGSDLGLREEVEDLLRRDESDADTNERFDQPLISPTPLSPPLESTDPLIGQRVGPYELKKRLGSGGFGAVYLAHRTDEFERKVAIKLIREDREATELILTRFELERQVLSDLQHEGIARLHDGGRTDDGRPFFVMEYVDGQPITKYCDQNRLNIEERLKLFQRVCHAAAHAHQYGIVHRDLKPQNILVTRDGSPKLVDFGIAKLIDPRSRQRMLTITQTGQLPMTPEYASPEQLRGDTVGQASDVYSLGVVLYELLTGHRPYSFRSHLLQEIERVLCEELPIRPSTAVLQVVGEKQAEEGDSDTKGSQSISRSRSTDLNALQRTLHGDLDNIVLMALRREPSRRYQSADQFAADIRHYFDGLPVVAQKDSLTYYARKFVWRHRRHRRRAYCARWAQRNRLECRLLTRWKYVSIGQF